MAAVLLYPRSVNNFRVLLGLSGDRNATFCANTLMRNNEEKVMNCENQRIIGFGALLDRSDASAAPCNGHVARGSAPPCVAGTSPNVQVTT